MDLEAIWGARPLHNWAQEEQEQDQRVCKCVDLLVDGDFIACMCIYSSFTKSHCLDCPMPLQAALIDLSHTHIDIYLYAKTTPRIPLLTYHLGSTTRLWGLE